MDHSFDELIETGGQGLYLPGAKVVVDGSVPDDVLRVSNDLGEVRVSMPTFNRLLKLDLHGTEG